MNRETYIRKVKKQLDCSVKEKEEIVRDLQEIFDSGKEHGKSESQIIKQLGKPQAYAQALGCGRQTMPLSGKRKVAVVFLAVGGLFCLYALGESLRFRMPKNAIGGGDIVTVVALYDHPQVLPLPDMYGKNLTFKTGGVDGCDCAEILRLIEEGKIDTTPLITHRFPLYEIEEAYRIFENKLDGVMKVAVSEREE